MRLCLYGSDERKSHQSKLIFRTSACYLLNFCLRWCIVDVHYSFTYIFQFAPTRMIVICEMKAEFKRRDAQFVWKGIKVICAAIEFMEIDISLTPYGMC